MDFEKKEDSQVRVDGQVRVSGDEKNNSDEESYNNKKNYNLLSTESDEEIMRKRKEKLISFLKSKQLWVFGVLIIALILGIYIRCIPMTDHGEGPASLLKFIFTPLSVFDGTPGLWDITTNTWTLGPDLDPWLFLRNAKTIVETGSLPERDYMRNVPLGFDNTIESKLLPYMIAWTYYLFRFLGMNINIEFAGAIFPVIMFGLTIISFFLFVREIFVRKSKKAIFKANIIALISSFFMIVIPIFLSRTVAGIPEKESAAFFFMFLCFYLYLKFWKSKKYKNVILFSILTGISTGLMGLLWGGFTYVFVSIGFANIVAFVFNKLDKRKSIGFCLWVFSSFSILIFFSNRYTLMNLFTSVSTGIASLLVIIIIIHSLIWKTNLSKAFNKYKIPKHLISFIISIFLIIILASIFLSPSFVFERINTIHQTIFKPIQGRWNITVAENRQPNFREWSVNFGPFIKNIPLMFWLFFSGSVVLFKKMLKKIKNKDAWILTFLYAFFFFGIVFSRYSGESIFNGDNFISKTFYYSSALLLISFFIYYYIKYSNCGEEGFRKIRFEYILLFSIFILTLLTARGAVRVIMVLGPIAVIFVGFLIVESIDRFQKSKDETWKIILGVILILILISSIYCFWIYYNSVKSQAYNFIPSSYNIQWQKAMQWVREETPKNSVFGHWWDYGYWVQSIGNRATVTDGGNAIVYWNYLMGRLVLTGDNQEDALEFLYNHNTTHFLIDSSDIGKYTAYSSIGSDEDYDRYSWFGTFLLDEKQTQETNNQSLLIYSGGITLDEDLVIEKDGKEILLPKGGAGVGAIILPQENIENRIGFSQPYIIAVYQGMQHKVSLRYLHINGEFFDFKQGIEACAYIFPRLDQQSQGLSQNQIGAAFFISPRLFRGMMSQIFILNDPLERYPNFKLVHTESNLFINDLRNQGMEFPDFIYYQGIQGPIKIWEIEYTGDEEMKQEYLDSDYSKYIDWRL